MGNNAGRTRFAYLGLQQTFLTQQTKMLGDGIKAPKTKLVGDFLKSGRCALGVLPLLNEIENLLLFSRWLAHGVYLYTITLQLRQERLRNNFFPVRLAFHFGFN